MSISRRRSPGPPRSARWSTVSRVCQPSPGPAVAVSRLPTRSASGHRRQWHGVGECEVVPEDRRVPLRRPLRRRRGRALGLRRGREKLQELRPEGTATTGSCWIATTSTSSSSGPDHWHPLMMLDAWQAANTSTARSDGHSIGEADVMLAGARRSASSCRSGSGSARDRTGGARWSSCTRARWATSAPSRPGRTRMDEAGAREARRPGARRRGL